MDDCLFWCRFKNVYVRKNFRLQKVKGGHSRKHLTFEVLKQVETSCTNKLFALFDPQIMIRAGSCGLYVMKSDFRCEAAPSRSQPVSQSICSQAAWRSQYCALSLVSVYGQFSLLFCYETSAAKLLIYIKVCLFVCIFVSEQF